MAHIVNENALQNLIDVWSKSIGLENCFELVQYRDPAGYSFRIHAKIDLGDLQFSKDPVMHVADKLRDIITQVKDSDLIQSEVEQPLRAAIEQLKFENAELKERIKDLTPYRVHYNMEFYAKHGKIPESVTTTYSHFGGQK